MQEMMTESIERQVPRLDGTGGQGMLVKGLEIELGYFSLVKFEQANRSYGFNLIERDLHWTPRVLADCLAEEGSA
ncbi:hypothetical protein EII22_08900 [Coriobacteriales bacterium OH1046]|nr:hypothetical protein EII22_08900 [Coriobacteriales bacterium OH1046]